MFFNDGRRIADVGHLRQFLSGVETDRQTEFVGEFDDAGFIGFEVDAGKPGQTSRRQTVRRQDGLQQLPNLGRGGSPIAAQTHEK